MGQELADQAKRADVADQSDRYDHITQIGELRAVYCKYVPKAQRGNFDYKQRGAAVMMRAALRIQLD